MEYFDKERGFVFPLTEERQKQINNLLNYEYKSAKWISDAIISNFKTEKMLAKKLEYIWNIFNLRMLKRWKRIMSIDAYYSNIFHKINGAVINDTAYYLLYNSIEKHKIMRGLDNG